mmetsp:Transcript_55098/g.154653  ORF Transcript_55098/g.154653 Transcript_55098/m.154653 type:complete len:168 (-) Transcript_55098:76-579(-)
MGQLAPGCAQHCCAEGSQSRHENDLVDEPMVDVSEFMAPFGVHIVKKKASAYRVKLIRHHGERLGLDVEHAEGSEALPIIGVHGGACGEWNSQNPAQEVSVGDVLVEVNGVRGDVDKMLDRCHYDSTLNMVLLRGVSPSAKDWRHRERGAAEENCRCTTGWPWQHGC